MPTAPIGGPVPALVTATVTAGKPCHIGPELTIAQAKAVREQLLQALALAPTDLWLDLGGVSDCDSSGVQLLLVAWASLWRQGRALHVVAASPAVRDALAAFGLAELLLPAGPDAKKREPHAPR